MPVYFYTTTDAYGCFSNFSRHGFELDGRYWTTAEQYFQAQKFVGTEHAEHIARARTPKEAAERGRSRAVTLRPDWEAVKDDVMRAAVRRKFEAHADIRAILLGTGDEELVENAPGDFYWGCGADGSGQNMLGRILMEVRAALRGQQDAESDAAPDRRETKRSWSSIAHRAPPAGELCRSAARRELGMDGTGAAALGTRALEPRLQAQVVEDAGQRQLPFRVREVIRTPSPPSDCIAWMESSNDDTIHEWRKP